MLPVSTSKVNIQPAKARQSPSKLMQGQEFSSLHVDKSHTRRVQVWINFSKFNAIVKCCDSLTNSVGIW